MFLKGWGEKTENPHNHTKNIQNSTLLSFLLNPNPLVIKFCPGCVFFPTCMFELVTFSSFHQKFYLDRLRD